MIPFTRPLICLSLTEPDEGVLRYAAMLARLFQWREVQFLHVVPPDRRRKFEPGPWEERLQAEASRWFDDPALACELKFHVAEGSRLDRILEAAARERARFDSARSSADAERAAFARAADGDGRAVERVAGAGGVAARDQQHPGADRLFGAQLRRAGGGDQRGAGGAGCASCGRCTCSSTRRRSASTSISRRFSARRKSSFEQFVARVDTAGVEVEPIYHESTRPSQAILRVAERCGSDLVVMNTRGRSQAAFVLLGSNTSEALAATTVPLLAVKHYGSRMGLRPGDLESAASGTAAT